MKIAIITTSYLFDKTAPTNGTFVQLHNLAMAFHNSGLEVHYICATADKDKQEFEVINGVHFHWIKKISGLLGWKNIMPYYFNILEKIKPDAIYTRGRNSLQYVAGTYARKNEIPYVWGTNGEDSAEFWKNVKRLKDKKESVFYKLALLPFKFYEDFYINKGMKLPNVIINQSKNQQYHTKKNLKKEGVILSSYFLPIQSVQEKKNQILWLANLSEGKQPEIFIEIIKKINLNNWQAILAGGTSNNTYKAKIEELVSETDIIMPGVIAFEDSFNYYKKARIYINTSKANADGLPNAYIQSWLSGTVVFSLHHDPNYWMEAHNIGYCAHGDFNKLCQSIQKVIDNPSQLEEMSNNAITFANQTFSSQDIIQNYISFFKGHI